jgi:hypothetical protein
MGHKPGSAEMWADYTEFHRLMSNTRDMDPVYPVYRELADELHLTSAQRVWLVLAHVAYYHAGSALAAFSGTNGLWDAGTARLDLPCATERRGHRSAAALSAHLNDLARRANEIMGWYQRAAERPENGWNYLTGMLATVHGNGRWAAYKTAEMFQQVCRLPIEAPDMDHASSSGPRKGLALLYEDDLPQGSDWASVHHLDSLSREVVAHLSRLNGNATVETAETSLCDFHSLATGRYYVGHDIDVMQEQLNAVPSSLTGDAFAARLEALPFMYLGEMNGRSTVDRARRRTYLDTGKIVKR